MVASAQPTPRLTQLVLACCHVNDPDSATKQLPFASHDVLFCHGEAVADDDSVAEGEPWLHVRWSKPSSSSDHAARRGDMRWLTRMRREV
jgi:hypothetical protein